MPVAHINLLKGHSRDALRRVIVDVSEAMSTILEAPKDRLFVWITEHDRHLWGLGGVLAEEALAHGTLAELEMPFVQMVLMDGRPKAQVHAMIAAVTESVAAAIARRVRAGRHVLLADLRKENADAAAKVLNNAGFEVTTAIVDVSSRGSVHALVETATAIGDVTGVIHAAGVSPSQASPATILEVDLYGTALVLEEFGNVIARGGSAVVIASQSGHRLGALTADENATLALTPADDLLALPMLRPDRVKDSSMPTSSRSGAMRRA